MGESHGFKLRQLLKLGKVKAQNALHQKFIGFAINTEGLLQKNFAYWLRNEVRQWIKMDMNCYIPYIIYNV